MSPRGRRTSPRERAWQTQMRARSSIRGEAHQQRRAWPRARRSACGNEPRRPDEVSASQAAQERRDPPGDDTSAILGSNCRPGTSPAMSVPALCRRAGARDRSTRERPRGVPLPSAFVSPPRATSRPTITERAARVALAAGPHEARDDLGLSPPRACRSMARLTSRAAAPRVLGRAPRLPGRALRLFRTASRLLEGAPRRLARTASSFARVAPLLGTAPRLLPTTSRVLGSAPRLLPTTSRVLGRAPRLPSRPRRACSEAHRACSRPRRACSEAHRACSRPRRACSDAHRACSRRRRACSDAHRACSRPRRACSDAHRACSPPRRTSSGPRRACSEGRRPCSPPHRRWPGPRRAGSEAGRAGSKPGRPPSPRKRGERKLVATKKFRRGKRL